MNQPAQQQQSPGSTQEMQPRPDHGEQSYEGSGRLAGKAAVITGADSGIILVNNAAMQRTHENLEDIDDEEWNRTLATNLSAFFFLTKAALPHMEPGSSIIGTSSVNSDTPKPTLLPYDVTKAGVPNMVAALAQLLAPRGIRANSVAPVYVMLASDEASFVSGARVAVTGGRPIL